MITNHAAAVASCTGTWQQKLKCGWNEPVSPAAHAGTTSGHSLLPVLAVLLVAFLIFRFARSRKKSSSSATAGAGR